MWSRRIRVPADCAGHLRSTHEAISSGRLARGEATVGAGLPIMDTLEMLVASGDEVIRVEMAAFQEPSASFPML